MVNSVTTCMGNRWIDGVTLLAGYDFWGSFSLQIQTQFGLSNLQPEVDRHQPEGVFKNRSYNVSVGYKF